MLGASDATYHIMWIIIFNALDDFGIKEVNDISRNGSPLTEQTSIPMHIEEMKKKVLDEALHGALRIAGLVCQKFSSKLATRLNGLSRREF